MTLEQAVYTKPVFKDNIMGLVGGGVRTAYILMYKHGYSLDLVAHFNAIFRLFSHSNCTGKMAFISIMSTVKKRVFCFKCSSSLENTFKYTVFSSQLHFPVRSYEPALYNTQKRPSAFHLLDLCPFKLLLTM